jgi:ethanolamine-phosphate phospho-lyase
MKFIENLNLGSTVAAVTKLDGYGSENYKVQLQNGTNLLIKKYKEDEMEIVQEVNKLLVNIEDKILFKLPFPLQQAPFNTEAYKQIVISNFISGECLQKDNASNEVLVQIATAAAQLLNQTYTYKSALIKANEHVWNLRDALLNEPSKVFITNASDRKIVEHYFSLFKTEVHPWFSYLPQGIIHSDLNENNIIVHNGNFSGFIDFGDISYAPLIAELAILLTYVLMMFPNECMQKAEIIIQHFQKIHPYTQEEISLLPILIATRLCVSVCNSAKAKASDTDSEYILISEKPAWQLLHKWVAYNPVYLKNNFLRFAGYTITTIDSDAILLNRTQVATPSLSLSYKQPIHMHSALFQYMYDAHGNTYLDAYNNIPHIGHCHPNIVAAAQKQTQQLNTNTRYLYDIYNSYSEKLLALFPTSLKKAILVNSGSEASDLATRIARTIHQTNGIAVMEWGYHGNTQNGINISAYKFDRKGGKGAEETILKLPLPKAYNGKFDNVHAYVQEAKILIEKYETTHGKLAAFIAEPINGCGGQVPLMEGYLQALVPFLKQRNILVIIDEVQTGFGRLGSWMWGFEMHGILPDMVVLGKPIANGHPMGAVVTTEAITNAFTNGMEFFSSFGGNPVSCAIGTAVIDTIAQEGLQQNAKKIGNYWMSRLRDLSKKYPLLGNVRGEGLFIGVECITTENKENTLLAQHIKEQLKLRYILSSTDGPLDNTLKMKPPLCITKENVDFFMWNMEEVLRCNNGLAGAL